MLFTSAMLAGLLWATPMALAGPGSGKKISADDRWLELPQLATSVPQIGGLRANLQVHVGLLIDDAKVREKADRLAPRLRAALGEALRQYVALYYQPSAAPDPDAIGRLSQQAVDEVLGGPEQAKLLFTSITVQDV